MCIIAYKKSDVDISKKTLRNCWDNNSDGAGYMFADKKKLRIRKGLMSWRRFWRAYRSDLKQYPSADFVLHFRIGTHGKTDKANTHPFLVHNRLGFCHNGILASIGVPRGSKHSDTALFVKDYLSLMPDDMLTNKGIVEFLDLYAVSESSKFVFLHATGFVLICNEDSGTWDKDSGAWFSNTGYKSEPRKTGWGNGAFYGNDTSWKDYYGYGTGSTSKAKRDAPKSTSIVQSPTDQIETYISKVSDPWERCDMCDEMKPAHIVVEGICNKCAYQLIDDSPTMIVCPYCDMVQEDIGDYCVRCNERI
jgi:hypothetical protein